MSDAEKLALLIGIAFAWSLIGAVIARFAADVAAPRLYMQRSDAAGFIMFAWPVGILLLPLVPWHLLLRKIAK